MDLSFPEEWKAAPPKLVDRPSSVNNRRTMCAHCSLRQDMPGFISREPAEGHAQPITTADILDCHMIKDPLKAPGGHDVCLGAALVGRVPLANMPVKDLPPFHDSLDEYIATQVGGRKKNLWLEVFAEKWYDRHSTLWYG